MKLLAPSRWRVARLGHAARPPDRLASRGVDIAEDASSHPIESAVARACATIDPSLGRRFPGQVVEGSVPWTSERRWSCHRISSWGLSDRWGTCSIMSGEAERVLERCSTVLQRGEFVFLGERERQRLQRELAEVSRAGLLAVGVAFLPIPPAVSFPPRIPGVPSDFPTSGLSFAGYFTVRWRPRRDAGESLALAARSAVRLLLTTHHPLPWVHAVLEDSDLATAAPENASLVAGAVVSAAEVAHDPWNIKSEVLHRRLAVVAGLQGGALPRVLAELAAQGDGTLVIGTGADDLDAMRAGRGVAWGGPLPGVPPHEAEGAVRGYVTDRNLSTAIEAVAEARKLVGGALWWPEAGPGPCGDPDDAARSRPFAGPPYPYMHR
eukprot:tig00020592_g11653.t1